MRSLLALVLLLTPAAGQWTEDGELRRQTSRRVGAEPVKAVVNLDLPPQDRWAFLKSDPVFKDFKANFLAYIEAFVPKTVLPLLTKLVGGLQIAFDSDYGKEMNGIANALDLTIGDVVLINLIYQLEHLGSNCTALNTTGPCPSAKERGPGLCTGFVAHGPGEQDAVWQGRNMDWNLDSSLLQYVMQVDFQKGGVTIFSTVQIAGMVGSLHGIRKGVFSVQMNARDQGGSIFANLVEQLLLGARTPSHTLRRALETTADFAAAESLLSTTRLANPVYYIMAGAQHGEGAIVTRARNNTIESWHLGEQSKKDVKKINVQPDWFRLQTNYDHWEPAPTFDDRRNPGVAHAQQTCAALVNEETVFKLMTTWPTQNHHTDVTSIMCPSTGYISTTVWLPGTEAVVV